MNDLIQIMVINCAFGIWISFLLSFMINTTFKMKNKFIVKFYLFLLFSFFRLESSAQCNSWLQLSSFGTAYEGWDITSDSNNNTYYTGSFTDTLTLGNFTLRDPFQYGSFYVAKLNSSGTYQWAVSFPVDQTYFAPVICHYDGFLYVACVFIGNIHLGSTTVSAVQGTAGIIVVKMDLNGNVINYTTAYSSSGSGYTLVTRIRADRQGRLYITGRSKGNLAFGSTVLNSTTVQYIYLAQIDTSLNWGWAIQSVSTSATSSNRGWAISIDSNDEIILGGYFKTDIQFGTVFFAANNTTGNNANPFIAKFDSSGNCLWIRGASGPTYFSSVYALTSDASNAVYIAGNLDTTLVFSPDTLNPANGCFYYCKYSPAGDLIWAKQTGPPGPINSGSPTILLSDSSSELWMSGWINTPLQIANTFLPNPGVFLARLDTSGVFHEVVGSKGLAGTFAAVLDADRNVKITGTTFGDTIEFSGSTFIAGTDSLNADFVVKYCPTYTRIDEQPDQPQLLVYPNPACNTLQIHLNSSWSSEKIRISIYNMRGDLLRSNFYSRSDVITQNIEKIASGLYLINLSDGIRSVSTKFIVE